MKKVLLAFDDPGGGLVVSSLLDELMKIDSIKPEVLSGKLSEKFVKDFHCKKLDSDLSDSEAEKIVEEISPDLIITATGGGHAEQELRNIAFRKNIMSIVILDFWKDYKRRWKYASYNLDEMKDKVCVMDKLTKVEMISEGFPGEKLIVTGHTYLDKIFNYYNSAGAEKQENKDHKENELNILFLSQPLNIIGIVDYKIHPLDIFMQAVSEYGEVNEKKIKLIIKPHPMEKDLDELESISKKFKESKTEISFSEAGDEINRLIEEADIVAGYNTIAMFEARAKMKWTISLNVVPVKDSLIKAMETAGIEIIECRKEEIQNCLKLNKENKKTTGLFTGGIQNCIELVKSELSLN